MRYFAGGGGGGLTAAQLAQSEELKAAFETWLADSGGGGGGLTTEVAQDLVAAMMVAGTNVTSWVYNDAAGTLTLNVAGGGGATDPEVVRDTMASALTAGSGIAVTANDAGDTITIAVVPTVIQTTQPDSAYTLVAGDANTVVEFNNAAAVTLTVPPNSSVAFPTGTTIGLRQYGAGQVTVAPGAGVTIRSRGALSKLAGQYAEATLTKRTADEWVLSGDLA